MGYEGLVRGAFDRAGYTVYNCAQPHVHSKDGLPTVHLHDIIHPPAFKATYARGIRANGADHHMR